MRRNAAGRFGYTRRSRRCARNAPWYAPAPAFCSKICSVMVRGHGNGDSSTPIPHTKTFDQTGHATVESRSGDTRQINLAKSLCKEFIRDLEAVGPLIDIPVVHCPKSVSFGSSLFIEYKGSRSPDISCPSHDLRMGELSKHANQILQAAREATGIPSRTARPHRLPSPAQ